MIVGPKVLLTNIKGKMEACARCFGQKINFIHVSDRIPSLPLHIAGSKALNSVESFLFVEPAICLSASEISTLVAPAIFLA